MGVREGLCGLRGSTYRPVPTPVDAKGRVSLVEANLIAECAEGASNHDQFVTCVSHLTNDLKKAGTITRQQKSAIQSCGGRLTFPNVSSSAKGVGICGIPTNLRSI